MQQISLKTLLEAGAHFGHKVERWHPKAAVFIYGEKEGVHIIDLAKTKAGLEKAGEAVLNMGKSGKNLLLVGTKRQARGVVTKAAKKDNIFYLTNRWVGGFLTNWEEVKKNIDKLNRMKKESTDGSWNQFPKHERVQLEKEMRKLASVYGGVAALPKIPDAVFIVDIKKEYNAVQEAIRRNVPILAVVDTNCNPTLVSYPIPANDDAVGSIEYVTNYIADSYAEGKALWEKEQGKLAQKTAVVQTGVKPQEVKNQMATLKTLEMKKTEPKVEKEKPPEKKAEKAEGAEKETKPEKGAKKKRGRPRKQS